MDFLTIEKVKTGGKAGKNDKAVQKNRNIIIKNEQKMSKM